MKKAMFVGAIGCGKTTLIQSSKNGRYANPLQQNPSH